ncbi:NIPSNAP protein [Prosthecobacter debontii]|uniref:NIPSNAP protein n=2 Tax=Prosthecobacter debontii TaxID=48467 RepID=A0A1T4YZ31_9BACT|nr:NIPSNAP protein [Prosthecobacter debontii]
MPLEPTFANLLMTRRLLLTLSSVFALSSFPASVSAAPSEVYELRIYTTNEGKLDALLARFRDHTCRLFEKHGMTNIGYWVPLAEEDGASNTLIYILKHASEEAAKTSFAAFGKDPEWQAARKASEEGGKILAKPPQSIFMQTTDYSPPIQTGSADSSRVFELRTYTTPPGKLDALHERFRNHTMKLFSKHGMTHIGYWTPTPSSPDADHKLIYILSHASHEAGLASFTAFRQDPEWITAKAASEKDGSLTLPQPEGVKSIYLRPTDFSPTR